MDTHLLSFARYVFEAVGSHKQVYGIYTDFSKAFDTVSHSILINKLGAFGFHRPLYHWLLSYLSDWSLCVRINNCHSFSFQVRSGVPQWSHPGPVLFLIFIYYIASVDRFARFPLFADNLKLSMALSSPIDVNNLQADFLAVERWCERNILKIIA